MLKKKLNRKNKTKQSNQKFNKGHERYFSKGDLQMAKKKRKQMKINLIRHYKEAQIKTIIRHHYTPNRMANKK